MSSRKIVTDPVLGPRMSKLKQNSNRRNLLSDAAGEQPRESINNYTRAVRRKLYVLFALLVVVIVLMREAKKPENWMWMGFKSSPTHEALTLNPDLPTVSEESPFENGVSSGVLAMAQSNEQEDSAVSNKDAAAAKFWTQVWQHLETQDRTALVELVQLSQESFDKRDINPADFAPLISSLVQSTPSDAGYAEQWESTILPGLVAVQRGEDLTVAQQSAVKELFKPLDPMILEGLDDFTSPGRKIDMPAWFRYWGRILKNEETESVTTVSPVQLVAQPDVWRFKPIRVRGRLLAGRMKNAGVHGPLRRNGVWYEWWIGNTHGASEVWCVYTAYKPDSIDVGENFSKFDLAVESDGLFYKVRSYVDAESKGNHCPLILSRGLTITQKSNPVAAATWIPSPTVMAVCIAGVMAVAFTVAMMLYRSDRHRIHKPGGEYKKQIESHLDSLIDDPEIKTVEERLEELS